MTDRIRRLELIGHATWPALEQEWLNGWLLRAAGGVTRRANSASPVYPLEPAIDLDGQIDRCEAWFEQRGLPPTFRLSPLADTPIDRRLESRGYVRDPGAAIMSRPIARFPRIDASVVMVAGGPSEPWLDLMAQEPGRSGARREVLGAMFGRIEGRAGFAGIAQGDRMLAIGLAVVADEYVSLFMVRTREAARRRGLAKAISAALVEWGSGSGATHAFLQVHPVNAPAIALYRSLGFEYEYEYWYRQAAGDGRGGKPGT